MSIYSKFGACICQYMVNKHPCIWHICNVLFLKAAGTGISFTFENLNINSSRLLVHTYDVFAFFVVLKKMSMQPFCSRVFKSEATIGAKNRIFFLQLQNYIIYFHEICCNAITIINYFDMVLLSIRVPSLFISSCLTFTS